MSDQSDERYLVVLNDEEQYSIWPQGRDVPAGWHTVGEAATKEECLAYIEAHWTDMRPLSLRKAMAADPVDVAAAPEVPQDTFQVPAGTDQLADHGSH